MQDHSVRLKWIRIQSAHVAIDQAERPLYFQALPQLLVSTQVVVHLFDLGAEALDCGVAQEGGSVRVVLMILSAAQPRPHLLQ